MTYSKPELTVLGNASVVIEDMITKNGSSLDGDGSGQFNVASAYDLDE
jgi:hypothetical protein